MDMLTTISEHNCFGGVQGFFQHDSIEIGLPVKFSVYLPPQATESRVPALLYLAGLTCNEETFTTKAGAQRLASELGLALIAPDTSPRSPALQALPGASDSWDFGIGAGFYIDATQAPWSTNWRMESYLVHELLPLLVQAFPVDGERIGLLGHSMGGHGALTLALKYPGLFKSLSAFAPICAPTQCPWGEKAFTHYLGSDRTSWRGHDATALMHLQSEPPYPHGILIDQGLADKFLADQLHPDLFDEACAAVNQPLTLRKHTGYDHGYYFIQSFIADHLKHHYRSLAESCTAETSSL